MFKQIIKDILQAQRLRKMSTGERIRYYEIKLNDLRIQREFIEQFRSNIQNLAQQKGSGMNV